MTQTILFLSIKYLWIEIHISLFLYSTRVFTLSFLKQVPTPIQRKSLPYSLDGSDIVGMARTGSGKTGAFLVPLVQKLKSHSLKMGARALILAPTRELALQTFKFCTKMSKFTDLRSCLLVGGDSMQEQFAQLAKNPDVIIATPGRLMHQLQEVDYSLNSIQYIVFDEADRLFEMGFEEQLKEILSRLPQQRQTLLFSATLPSMLVEFARAGLNDPKVVRLDSEIKLSEMLTNHFLFCRAEEKMGMLIFLLKSVIKEDQQTIIFVSTRHHVDFLNEILTRCGFLCSFVYGSMDQTARKINVAKFANKKSNLLIVTDVAARGIDIPLLDNVINYDFPSKPKLFVHRFFCFFFFIPPLPLFFFLSFFFCLQLIFLELGELREMADLDQLILF